MMSIAVPPAEAGSAADLPSRLKPRSALRTRLRTAGQFVGSKAAVPVHRLRGRAGAGFGILMYHRVTWDVAGVERPTWNVHPRRFEQQLVGLLARGWEAWPLRQALDYVERGQQVPDHAFVVTFDDGYQNVHRHAWPILKRLNVPATIFLSTAYLGSRQVFPFEDWAPAGTARVPAETWLPLSLGECHEMLADPLIEFGSHTHTHRDFRRAPDLLYEDLKQSAEVLRTEFGIERPTFSFPWGTRRLGFSGGAMTEAARRAGLCCSLTTEGELVQPGSDPFEWGRFLAEWWDTPATLAAKLSGSYSLVRNAWRGVLSRSASDAGFNNKRQEQVTSGAL